MPSKEATIDLGFTMSELKRNLPDSGGPAIERSNRCSLKFVDGSVVSGSPQPNSNLTSLTLRGKCPGFMQIMLAIAALAASRSGETKESFEAISLALHTRSILEPVQLDSRGVSYKLEQIANELQFTCGLGKPEGMTNG